MGQKHRRGVRFYFVLICTVFWLNVNRCTVVWHQLILLCYNNQLKTQKMPGVAWSQVPSNRVPGVVLTAAVDTTLYRYIGARPRLCIYILQFSCTAGLRESGTVSFLNPARVVIMVTLYRTCWQVACAFFTGRMLPARKQECTVQTLVGMVLSTFSFTFYRLGLKKKGQAPTLSRIRYMPCFNLILRSRCNNRLRCCYRPREHVDPT